MNNTVIFIPSRLSAKRFPNKPLAKINNIPISLDDNFNREKPSDLLVKKPQYSCLKNSSLPTFREWKKLTQKNNH